MLSSLDRHASGTRTQSGGIIIIISYIPLSLVIPHLHSQFPAHTSVTALPSQRIFAWDRKLSTNTPPSSVRSGASARLFSFDFPAYGWIGKASGFGLMKCALMRNILIVSLTTTAPFAISCLLMMRSLDKKNRTSSSMCSLIDVY